MSLLILPTKRSHSHGQAYLDILITIAILLILSAALITLVFASYELISFTRARITARHLAEEKIELIRNLPYANVGTIGGIPSGPLAQTENVNKNELNYLVKTSIVYIDDPFDGNAPNDLLPTDYKRVRVDVSWKGTAASEKNPITLITDITPRGIEPAVGGGTLSILIFNASGEPVPQTSVHIVAEGVSPEVDLSLESGDDGRIILPGAPICVSCYQISVSKESYSSERTYSTEEIINPYKPHQTIIEGQLTEISFAIDKLSTLVVHSTKDREFNFIPLPNQQFRLRGDKILGTDVMDEPVYKFDQSYTTNDLGEITINDLEWDNYHLFLPAGSGWDIAGTNPLTPINVLPDQTRDFVFALMTHTNHSLLTVFKDSSQAPIASVAARLSTPGFEATGSSGLETDPDFGQFFFSNLSSQIYLLQATVSGFLDYSDNVDVSGTTKEEIIMSPE